jgi:transposase-like protein
VSGAIEPHHGVVEGAKEDKAGWSGFLRHLKERGLKDVKMFITDACMGLVESLGDFYPDAKWQRCMVHFYRNIFSVVPRKKMSEVSAMLKAIHASEDREAADQKAACVCEKLRAMRLPQAAEKIEQSIAETLTYYCFPRQHWRRIRTNNALERIMREIRRRTRVVGAFPDGNSALMLCAARLRHIAGTRWGQKRYLNMELLKDQLLEEAMDAIA